MRNFSESRQRCAKASVAMALVVGLLAVGSVGCQREQVDPNFGLASYQADFNSPDELKNWKSNDVGKWEIRSGLLVGDARTSDNRSILWLDKPLAENVRIEFQAESVDRAGDLNCFLCGNGQDYSGYEIILGGWENTKVAVYRSTADGDPTSRHRMEREDFKLEKGRPYSVKIEKDGGKIRLYVNGELLVTATDDEPLRDTGHRHFGFSTFQNVVRFDNLKIEKIGPP